VPESATSTYALHTDRLARLVAASTTFQTLVGAGSAALALPSVYYPSGEDDGTETLPRAIITQTSELSITALGIKNFSRAGQLNLTIELEVPASDDNSEKEKYIYAMNRFGDIANDIATKARLDDPDNSGETFLNVISVTVEDGPYEEAREESEHESAAAAVPQPVWWIVFLVEWAG